MMHRIAQLFVDVLGIVVAAFAVQDCPCMPAAEYLAGQIGGQSGSVSFPLPALVSGKTADLVSADRANADRASVFFKDKLIRQIFLELGEIFFGEFGFLDHIAADPAAH